MIGTPNPAEASKFTNDLLQIFTRLREEDGIDEECMLWWKQNGVTKKKNSTRKSMSKRATSEVPELPPLFGSVPELPPSLESAGLGKEDDDNKERLANGDGYAV